MEKIKVYTHSPYEVVIGKDLKDEALSFLPEQTRKVVLLWDESVKSRYVAELGNAIEATGREVMAVSLEGGESAKTLSSFEKITSILVEFNLSRSDILVGIGGGTVMDLAGFIASTYKRGIGLIQIPTTLLAASDASVGGKNALDLGSAKNVIGTFYQPSLVLIDTKFFDTLSDGIYSEGCAEIIKYGFIGDAKLVSMLEEKSLLKNRNDEQYVIDVLRRCIKIKAEIVSKDERDEGIRNVLNFGHTLGHAIEAESNYNIHHGEAVAMGMVLITQVAEKKGIAEQGTLAKLISILTSHGLQWRCPYNINALVKHVNNDKKLKGGKVTLVLPERAGDCILVNVSMDELKTWLVK